MKKLLIVITLIGSVLATGCSDESRPMLDQEVSTEIIYDGRLDGGGKDNKESILIRPNTVNSDGSQFLNTEIHISNSSFYTWGVVGPLDTLELNVPEFGPYNYLIIKDDIIIMEEEFDIYDSLIYRVDTL